MCDKYFSCLLLRVSAWRLHGTIHYGSIFLNGWGTIIFNTFDYGSIFCNTSEHIGCVHTVQVSTHFFNRCHGFISLKHGYYTKLLGVGLESGDFVLKPSQPY